MDSDGYLEREASYHNPYVCQDVFEIKITDLNHL